MSRKHWLWFGGGVALGALVAAGYIFVKPTLDYAQIAVNYAAKQTCACLNVSARSLDSCLADFPEDARARIKISVNGERVEASAYGLFKAAATHEQGYGCRIGS